MSYGLETLRSLAQKRAQMILCGMGLLLLAGGLNAQNQGVALKGLVFDSATGQGLADVAIHVNQRLVPTYTDTLGEFLIPRFSPGPHTLTLAKDGFAPRLFAVSVTEDHRDTVDLGSFPLSHAAALTATISGTVLNARTGSPVVVSGVYVNGNLAYLSVDGGQFTTGRIEVSPGLNMLEFKRIGYEPFQAQIWAVQSHTVLDLTVQLIPTAVRIPTVVVEGSYLREFHQRREFGNGFYITQQEIEEQHPTLISDMLRTTPGIRVLPGRTGGNRVLGICNLFIDGIFISTAHSINPTEEIDALVHPDNVAAMEVYTRPTGVPVQYNNRGAACGVLLVWTRR